MHSIFFFVLICTPVFHFASSFNLLLFYFLHLNFIASLFFLIIFPFSHFCLLCLFCLCFLFFSLHSSNFLFTIISSHPFLIFFILMLSALARSYQSCIACCRLVGCGFDFRSALGMQFVTFGMQLKMWFMRKHPSRLRMELKYTVYQVYTYLSLSFSALWWC